MMVSGCLKLCHQNTVYMPSVRECRHDEAKHTISVAGTKNMRKGIYMKETPMYQIEYELWKNENGLFRQTNKLNEFSM